jgi:DNA transformation protein
MGLLLPRPAAAATVQVVHVRPRAPTVSSGALIRSPTMALDDGYVAYVVELLEPLGAVTGRKMFGGYGIWEDGDMFALLDSASTLYFKVDDTTRARYADAGSEQFMTMPYWSVPVDVLEDDDLLQAWARQAMAVGHATSKKKRR